jgi:hypothetical protein
MRIHQYNELLNDQNVNIMDKVNSIIDYLNQVGKLTNDVVKDWNTVYQWVMNDGLTTDVNNKLEQMLANHEFDSIISTVVALVGDLNTLTTTDKTTIVNAINSLKTDLNTSIGLKADQTSLNTTNTKIGDLTTLQTADKDTIVHAINDNVTSLLTKSPKSKTDSWKDVITDFSAKGDGVTDDTTAIQSAFTYAQTHGNVNLYFPEGTYLISSYIQVYKNTTVHFHPNSIVKRIGTANKMFVNGQVGFASYVPNGVYTGEGNIHFYGGTFDMNCQVGTTSPLSASTTTSFFDMLHAEDISFNKITVKNGQIGHYFQVSSCKNVRFKDCWFGAVNYTGTGGTDYNYECIQVEVATSSSNPDFGVYDLTISRDVYVENCVFDGTIRAFGNHSDAQYGTGADILCENVNFINNRIFNPINAGLHLTGFKYSVIENNLIMNAGGDGVQTLKLQDSVIENNIIINPQKTGFYLDTTINNKFINNIIKDASQGGTYAGIRLTASNGNSFDGDTVSASIVKYSYAWFSSDASTGNKVKNNNYTAGTSGKVRDADGNHIERVTGMILGTAAPTTIPDFRGQEYLDTTNLKVYKAINTTASTDWLLLN